MNALFKLLATHKRWWLPPILIFVALLLWMAWQAAHAPDEPFDYRTD